LKTTQGVKQATVAKPSSLWTSLSP